MSGAVFTLRFRDQETLRSLERTAAALGVSTTDLAEAAIERELTVLGSDLDHRLTRALERLKTAGLTDLDQDIDDFARAELEVEDPLRGARRVEAPEPAEGNAVDTSDALGSKLTPAAHATGKMAASSKSSGKNTS